MNAVKLYHIQYDGQCYWVEASCFAIAILRWKDHVRGLWGEEYDGTEEPDSCALIHDEPVIR